MEKFKDPKDLSPLTLAFLGDAVITYMVRSHFVKRTITKVSDLHRATSNIINAGNQAKTFDTIKEVLTEDESDLANRAHNAKVNTGAKNFSQGDYRKATALEALVGYWHLKEETLKIKVAVLELLQGGKK